MDEGFVLVDKAGGWTSHDVVAKCRGIFGQRRIGHAGTLDPMATGLLVLGVGRVTRLLRFVQDGAKRYEAEIAFGIATDTLDADGAILDRAPMEFTDGELIAATERFVGVIAQVPPMVSAVRVGGRRLYELARAGEQVEREARQVEVYSIEVTEFGPGPYPTAAMTITCGSGTYIRTLADDIAQVLGGRAHLTSLRRTAIGSHDVSEAVGVEELDAMDDPSAALITAADALADLAAVTVDAATAVGVGNGMVFPAGGLGHEGEGRFRVIGPDGDLLAVYGSDGSRARPEVVLA
jgi:tRNA pseudouridine55 synthase